jgi:hypothetical protein
VDKQALSQILEAVQSGTVSIEQAVEQLRWQPVQALDGFARIDHHRALRQGMPEFIYAQHKSPEQTAEIVAAQAAQTGQVLVSRADSSHYEAVSAVTPEAIYHQTARLITVDQCDSHTTGNVLVVAAGTSDLPVAEEAAGVLRFLGDSVDTLSDVGVAGLHRLLSQAPTLAKADILIIVAGMEAALPTVVAGLVDCPVIAVPTSVGYGASFGGLAALLGMLNSCVPGVTVVNIDNGLGAAAAAHRMLMRMNPPGED